LNALGNTLKDFIAYVGDTSNLVLDPDLDSYYLMDEVVFAVPLLSGYMQDWVNHFSEQQAGEKSKIDSFVLGSKVKDNFDRSEASLFVALKEDSNFFGTNERLQTSVQKDFSQFKQNFTSLYEDMKSHIGMPVSEKLADRIVSFYDEDQAVWKQSRTALAELFDARISDIKSNRAQSLVVVFLCMFLAGCVGIFLQRSVVLPINRVLERLNAIAKSIRDTSTKLATSSQAAASAATEEAAAIQESVSAMSEMTSMLSQTSQHTEKAHELAQEVL
jgi:methyl-accepting chemotaxis protein